MRIPSGQAPLLEQVDPGKHAVEPLVGREHRSLLDERPRILVERYDMDLEIEPAGAHEPQGPGERSIDLATPDARHKRLRDPDTVCKHGLCQSGASPRFEA